MNWVAGSLLFLFLLGLLRGRRRLAALPVLRPTDAALDPAHRFIVHPDVQLDEATRRAASAHATASGQHVLDLLPSGWPADAFTGYAEIVDPGEFQRDPLSRGVTAGHALLVHTDVLDRLGNGEGGGTGPFDPADVGRGTSEWVELGVNLKRYCPTRMAMAVAPGLEALPLGPAQRSAFLRTFFGEVWRSVLVFQGIVIVLLALSAFVTPVLGWMALLAFHLQPALALLGRPFGKRRRLLFFLFRLPMDAWRWMLTAFASRSRSEPREVTALRAEYQERMGGGVERFLEERREDCPLCASSNLGVHLRTGDWIQHKPGVFTLENCHSCGHIFQNPRLTLEGLNFYYRDFYDRLGEERLEQVFSYHPDVYMKRARVIEGFANPKRWLDVGGGHGHFCLCAREIWPETRFELLDMSESVDEAGRRGWVDATWRGLFPEFAENEPDFEGGFDMVSMSHYLEHTRDPEAEIAAAARALETGGHLFVEVPDPEDPFGRVFGRFWLPWFQPQHQHLVRCDSLQEIMVRHGLEPVLVHRAEANQKADFTFSLLMVISRLAPPLDVPWRPPSSGMQRIWHGLVWFLGLPLLGIGLLLDNLWAPVSRRIGVADAYRVLARKI